MKLLLLIYSGDSPERVTALLDRHQVESYTELPGAHGAGRTGRRFGTRAWARAQHRVLQHRAG
jgi:hypothetical protein